MHGLAVLILLFQLTAFNLLTPGAQAAPIIRDMGVYYRFGEQITFQVQVESDTPVEEIILYLQPEARPTAWQKMSLANAEGEGTNENKNLLDGFATIEASQVGIFPFSDVTYYYELTLADGAQTTSDTFQFQYADDRFTWHQENDENFEVFWYSEDATLGQAILNAAEQGLTQALTVLRAEPPRPLRIYAYASSRDLQTALQINHQPWVAGHATPELGMILISVPSGPEQKLDLERQVPHEIMHILQYQVMGDHYDQQPVWLLEGMASLAELYPNPEYQRVLETSTTQQKLLPMNSLCTSFPQEAAGAFLSYAQSDSFVRFLYAKYGATGLRSLIDQYQNGLGCSEGVSAGLGTSLKQLEYRWKQEALGVNTGALVLRNLSPYLLLGLILVLPLALTLIPSRRRPTEKQP